jgi:hypothetical protein
MTKARQVVNNLERLLPAIYMIIRCGIACANTVPLSDPADTPYQISYRGGEVDANGNLLVGNNLMKLLPFNGKLYATTAVECDKGAALGGATPGITPGPGPQILVLDNSRSKWRLEKEFGTKPDGSARYKRVGSLITANFETDGQGRLLKQPQKMLVAGVSSFSARDKCAIFTGVLNGSQLEWNQTSFDSCRGESARALGFYRDPNSGIDRIFVGASLTTGPAGNSIYSGVFDPQAPGLIRWSQVPELSGYAKRIAAFAELNHRLFATAGTKVFERPLENAASSPILSWDTVYNYSGPTYLPLLPFQTGLRGLSPIGTDPYYMMAVMEGVPGDILRFTPTVQGLSAIHEARINPLFRATDLKSSQNDFGSLGWVRYYIAAFNDISNIQDPNTGKLINLIGVEQYNHLIGHEDSAWFVARGQDGEEYSLHEVKQLGQPLDPDLGLRAVRTIVISPFSEDSGRVLYMGGFDPVYECGVDPRGVYNLHDNAWVYRVGLLTALRAFSP